jgi:glycerophosphoryl diester phosphodiesterase
MKRSTSFKIPVALAAIFLLCAFHTKEQQAQRLHTLNIQSSRDLKEFFRYSSDRIAFVSAHRGGPRSGYPENCIATFTHTLQRTWAILEIDPHYTKDSAIVLMHDATLDRTTDGTGKVSDHTLEEIRKLKLKDTEGKLTAHKIPTLDEALEWARGKTILVLDQKDVSMDIRVKKIREHNASNHAMVIAYSLEDVKRCYALDKNIMMEVMVPDAAAAAKFETTGVPWENIVAFVTHTEPKDKSIYKYIHSKGSMCIIGSSRTIDKDYIDKKETDKTTLTQRYQSLVREGADIIEADLGVEAGEALHVIRPEKSGKSRFFIFK